MNYPIGTVVILARPAGLYMCQRINRPTWNGAWSSAGGATEEGEDPRQAALREVKEEAGLVIDPSRLIELGREWHDHPQGGQQDCAFFKVDLEEGEIPQRCEPEKHSEWELVPWASVFEKELMSGYRGPTMTAFFASLIIPPNSVEVELHSNTSEGVEATRATIRMLGGQLQEVGGRFYVAKGYIAWACARQGYVKRVLEVTG